LFTRPSHPWGVKSQAVAARQSEDEAMTQFLKRFAGDESGATAIEYGLIAALIAIVLVAAMTSLQGKISGTYDKVGNAMPQ
jgi:pilus assembly protein Flp/PilA